MHEAQYYRFVKRAKKSTPKTISEHNPSKQDEIIRMALEAGLPKLTEYGYESLQRFAELVLEQRTKELMQLFLDPENQPTQFGTATLEYREAEVLAEREACAQVCEQGTGEAVQKATLDILLRERNRIAKAIRARSEK